MIVKTSTDQHSAISLRTAVSAALGCLCGGQAAQAHPTGLGAGDAWWLAWHFDALVATVLGLLVLIYGGGLLRIWRRAGRGRVLAWWRVGTFGAGVVALGIALMSPLDTISNDLSWVHMTQHMVLMVIAAPLIVAGSPGLMLTWAMPLAWRKAFAAPLMRTARPLRGPIDFLSAVLWNPPAVWALHAVILWIWHVPILYEWALVDPRVHDVEHITFFIAACLFWRLVLDARKHRTMNPGLSVLYLFTTSLHAMVLGVFMALSPRVWYSVYEGRTAKWGLTALEDQQLAGLIMWMPACMVYAVVAAGIFAIWLQQLEDQDARSAAVDVASA